MNEENGWGHNVDEKAVYGPVGCVCRDKLLQMLNEIQTEKVPGPSDVSLDLIAASTKVGI